jgi:hypothetical protein
VLRCGSCDRTEALAVDGEGVEVFVAGVADPACFATAPAFADTLAAPVGRTFDVAVTEGAWRPDGTGALANGVLCADAPCATVFAEVTAFAIDGLTDFVGVARARLGTGLPWVAASCLTPLCFGFGFGLCFERAGEGFEVLGAFDGLAP